MFRLMDALWHGFPSKTAANQMDGVAVHGAARDGSRGRTATHPLEVPVRGWKDVLFRVWKKIGKDRVLLVGAGVTFYMILALFPAIAALVALYRRETRMYWTTPTLADNSHARGNLYRTRDQRLSAAEARRYARIR
jgi:hypothetical protein